MESAAVRVLAFLGLAAVVVCLALLCARSLNAALDGAIKKWRRLGIVPRVVAVMMAAIATVEAQKSGMGDSNRVERVDRVEGGGDFSRKGRKERVDGNESGFNAYPPSEASRRRRCPSRGEKPRLN